MTTQSLIGQRIPKLDAPDKAVGRMTYGHDVRLPGMLARPYSLFRPAPCPHCKPRCLPRCQTAGGQMCANSSR